MPLKENTEYLRSLAPINYIYVKCHPWPRGNSIDKQRKRGFNKFELSVSRYERGAVTPVRGVVGLCCTPCWVRVSALSLLLNYNKGS